MSAHHATWTQCVQSRLDRRDSAGQRGLALLDVLLGMAIFALIVVIGVQNFSTLRHRARVTAATSDAKQLGTAMHAYMTKPGVTDAPALATVWSEVIPGVNFTPGNNFAIYSTSGENFTVCVARGGGAIPYTAPSARYSSVNGSVIAFPNSGNCT